MPKDSTLIDGVIVVLLAATFAPALGAMAEIWSTVEYYSYAFLIAPVCAGMAWTRRPALARLPAARDPRGFAVVAAAVALLLTGFFARDVTTMGLATVLAVAGGVLALRGPAWLRALRFPVGYLLFLVPLPPPLISPGITALQRFVSEVAVRCLSTFEVPVLREGSVLTIPGGSLFVAEACSGISSIVTLVPAAVLLGYFTQSSLRGRLALVAAVVPIAMFWNLVRLVATVLAAVEVGVATAVDSALHEAAGTATYALGCLTLLALDRLARRDRTAAASP